MIKRRGSGIGFRQKRVDLSALNEFEQLTLKNMLEMMLDKERGKEAQAAIRTAIRHLQRPRRCTVDDLACVNAAVNCFLDWYEEIRPPIAEVAVACLKTALDKIASQIGNESEKGRMIK